MYCTILTMLVHLTCCFQAHYQVDEFNINLIVIKLIVYEEYSTSQQLVVYDGGLRMVVSPPNIGTGPHVLGDFNVPNKWENFQSNVCLKKTVHADHWCHESPTQSVCISWSGNETEQSNIFLQNRSTFNAIQNALASTQKQIFDS